MRPRAFTTRQLSQAQAHVAFDWRFCILLRNTTPPADCGDYTGCPAVPPYMILPPQTAPSARSHVSEGNLPVAGSDLHAGARSGNLTNARRPSAHVLWTPDANDVKLLPGLGVLIGCFSQTSNATIRANSRHACRLSRPTREASDRTTYARRPADPTERPTHLARRTTARRPSRGARAAASTREPCERCGAPGRCRRPPGRGQGGARGQKGSVAGQPCDTHRGARQSCPDARARNTTK